MLPRRSFCCLYTTYYNILLKLNLRPAHRSTRIAVMKFISQLLMVSNIRELQGSYIFLTFCRRKQKKSINSKLIFEIVLLDDATSQTFFSTNKRNIIEYLFFCGFLSHEVLSTTVSYCTNR